MKDNASVVVPRPFVFRPRSALRWLLSVALLSLAFSACAGRAPHPEQFFDEYAKAVEEGRADDVYEMLGEQQRNGMDREQFRAFFAQYREEMLQQAAQIRRGIQEGALDIQARVPVGGRSEIAMHYRDGLWAFQEAIPISARASSPEPTLVALSAAVEQNDMALLLSMLSKEKRDTLKAELGVIRDSLRKLDEDDIVVDGEVATIYLDFGLKLELLFEEGSWRIHRLLQY
ncbi:MAG: hypothetical protein RBU37_05820 [Myxococcota bacterium]|jgi:hypothetical protein|nr:hypothetical protein [Myxococcota bacterium]